MFSLNLRGFCGNSVNEIKNKKSKSNSVVVVVVVVVAAVVVSQ
jgi:hypothetical protein